MRRSIGSRLVGAVLVVLLIGWRGAPVRAASYTIADMGIVKGHISAIAYAINNDGVVVGISTDDAGVHHGVRLRDGKLRNLDIDENSTIAYAINDELVVVGIARELGQLREQDGPGHAIVWEKSKPSELPSLGGPISQALAINEKGVIVGHSTPSDESAVSHACRWVDGVAEDLGTLGGFSVANDVNERGWVVGGSNANTGQGAHILSAGAHAVLWRDGELIDLGTLPGGEIAQARAINEQGRIVGYSTTGPDQQFSGAGMHAFFWEDGAFTDLGTLPGADISLAFAVNEAGQIAGYAMTPGTPGDPTGAYVAVAWLDGQIVNLNDVIPADGGWNLTAAWDMNDAGQIVGTGLLNGEQRGFVLTPAES